MIMREITPQDNSGGSSKKQKTSRFVSLRVAVIKVLIANPTAALTT